MKQIKHILLSSVILLLTAGCTKEELPGEVVDTPGITLDLRIANPLPDTKGGAETTLLRSAEGNLQAGQVLTRAASLTPSANESVIKNVYVLFYAQSAAATSAPALFQAATGLNAQDGYSFDLDYNSLADKLVAGTKYDIYVLANLPSSTTTALSGSTTKEALSALNEQQFDRTTDPGISFSGSGTFTYDKGNRETIAIDLSRTVARLDIYLSGLSLGMGQRVEVRVFNQAATVPYFAATNTAPSPVRYFKCTTIRNYVTGGFYTYVYPNYEGSGYEKATLTVIVLNENGSVAYMYESAEINSGKIERNKIYEITCELKSS